MGFRKASARNHGVHIVVGALALLVTTASSAGAVAVSLPTNAIIATVGGTTTVDVNVGSVTNLEAAAVSIMYTESVADVLNTADVVRGPLTQNCSPPIVNLLDANRVTITMACPQVGGVTGSGMLFQITFTGISNGQTDLTLSDFPNIPNGCQLNEGNPACDPVTNGHLTVGQVTPTNTATISATATGTATVTRTVTATNTVGPVLTSTATASATASRTATASGTATASATNTATRTATTTVTDTATTGPSPTPSHTLTPSLTPTISPTASPSLSPTTTLTSTVTFTAAPATSTLTATVTVTPSLTSTASLTPTVTATSTITLTPSITATRPGIPVIPSPTSPAGLVLVGGLGVALLWALRRLHG